MLLKSSKIEFVTEENKENVNTSNISLKPKDSIKPFNSKEDQNNLLKSTSFLFKHHENVFKPLKKSNKSNKSSLPRDLPMAPKPISSLQNANIPPKMSKLDRLLENKSSKRIPQNLKHQRCRSMIGFDKVRNNSKGRNSDAGSGKEDRKGKLLIFIFSDFDKI